MLVPAQEYVGQFQKTLQEFPPRQKPGSVSIDKAMDQFMNAKPN